MAWIRAGLAATLLEREAIMRSVGRFVRTVSTIVSLAVLSGEVQQPIFRAGTIQVLVEAVVTGGDGKVVRGLSKGDFVVEEDGRPHDISTFSFVDIPLERRSLTDDLAAGSWKAGRSDVSSNNEPFDGRVYFLLLDDIQTATQHSEVARVVARRFIEQHFRDNDLMAIVPTSGRLEAWQDLTSNRRLLLRAVDAFVWRRSSRPPLVRSLDDRTEPSVNSTDLLAPRLDSARGMLDALRSIADWSGAVMPGRRKSIILVSEGTPGMGAQVERCDESGRGPSLDSMCDALAAAARANVVIFTVDPRGLSAQLSDIEDERTTERVDLPTSRQAESGQLSLRALAEDSGGLAVVNTNDVEGGLARIVRDSSSYYVLGFEARSPELDTFRRVRVRVEQPGLQVRARTGYALERRASNPLPGGRSAPLQRAISSPLPVSGLPLSVFAASFRGENGRSSVLIGSEVQNLGLKKSEKDGLFYGTAEIAYVVVAAQDVHVKAVDTVRLAVASERVAAAEAGVRILKRIDLVPGTYQLRVAVQDTGSGTTGSILRDLEVPDFARSTSTLSLSGLVLATADDRAVRSGNDARFGALGLVPTVRRKFSRAEELVAFVEVYENGLVAPRDIQLTTRVLAADGSVAIEVIDARSSQEFVVHRLVHAATLSLERLSAGQYALEVMSDALDGAGPKTLSVPFTVVGQAN